MPAAPSVRRYMWVRGYIAKAVSACCQRWPSMGEAMCVYVYIPTNWRMWLTKYPTMSKNKSHFWQQTDIPQQGAATTHGVQPAQANWPQNLRNSSSNTRCGRKQARPKGVEAHPLGLPIVQLLHSGASGRPLPAQLCSLLTLAAQSCCCRPCSCSKHTCSHQRQHVPAAAAAAPAFSGPCVVAAAPLVLHWHCLVLRVAVAIIAAGIPARACCRCC